MISRIDEPQSAVSLLRMKQNKSSKESLYSKDTTYRDKRFDHNDDDAVLDEIRFSSRRSGSHQSHNQATTGNTSNHRVLQSTLRSERRSLLPPTSSSHNSNDGDTTLFIGDDNNNNNNNNRRTSSPPTSSSTTDRRRTSPSQKRRSSRPPRSSPMSVRRKMHDLRLQAILNSTNDDDNEGNDDFANYGGDYTTTTRRNNVKEDWIRPYWLGLGLFLILFSFWILDTLKDPIFGALLLSSGEGLHYNLPRAKLFSVCTTLFLVVLLEYIAKEQKKQQQSRLRQQQQLQQQNELLTDDSEYDISNTVVPIRSRDDVLDGSGTWTRMNVGTLKSYQLHNQEEDRYANSAQQQQQQQRSQIFITIGVPFCIFFAMCAYFLQFNPNTAWTAGNPKNDVSSSASSNMDHMDPSTQQAWRVLGYCIYAAVESFGSLMVATFWSYTNSTLTLSDAETYYGTIIAIAQMGAIAGSTMVTMHLWNSITLFIVACLVILLHIIVMITYNRRFPPTRPTTDEHDTTATTRSLHNSNVNHNNVDEDDEPIVQLSGVRLILKHNYVLLILGVSCLYEVSLTCLNYQMTLLGWSKFEESNQSTLSYDVSSPASSPSSGGSFIEMMSFTQFMGHYGQMVNVCSLLLSSFIFPTLIYRVGLKYTLRLFPTLLLLVNIIAFIAMPGNLLVLFFSMSLLKATTYSIHDPAKEILYIPTSQAIQFNAKFWIDVVGARVAKAIGSSINHMSGSVHRSIRVASAPSLITAMGLWYVCYCIGTQFDTLIANHTIVGIDDDNDEDDGRPRSKINQNDFSEEHNDDGDGRGAVQETDASFELTAL